MSGVDGADDEVGVELDDVVVPEVFDEAVSEQSVGVVDENAVLVLLLGGRKVGLCFFGH